MKSRIQRRIGYGRVVGGGERDFENSRALSEWRRKYFKITALRTRPIEKPFSSSLHLHITSRN